ncbi:MAG: AMP-binding protein, partial [Congregibacter sp.]|nr:AMP-binding protein [Congregibacter sp.]
MLTESFARGPAEPAVRELTIGDALREAAADSPQQTALIAGTPDPANRQSWTFAQLLDEAERTAKALLESFEPGDRVAVWAPNIPQWVIMEYGCALAGVVLVTVNPSYQADELAYVLRQSKAAGIFMVSEFRGNAMLAHLEAVRGQCPELKKVVLFSQWQAFLDTAADKPLPRVLPGDACMIQYTSGTTGFPKGALLHHRGLVNNGAHSQAIMGAAPNLTYMGIMPLFHTGGCVLAVLGA